MSSRTWVACRQTLFLFGLVAVVAGSAPVRGHHIEVNEFDRSRPVTLTGEVVKVQWINPHPWIFIRVLGQDGDLQEWAVEAAAPMNLLRRGFSPASIPLGEVITLDGYQAKDGALRANGKTLTYADGRQFYIGYLGLIGTGEGDD